MLDIQRLEIIDASCASPTMPFPGDARLQRTEHKNEARRKLELNDDESLILVVLRGKCLDSDHEERIVSEPSED